MKAYVLKARNSLSYDDVRLPDCPRGWAIVKVKASGICSSDIARVFVKGTYNFPTIPGHEVSGVVYSVGDDTDTSYVGKRVGVFPLIPCRKCSQCLDKHYEMCENYDYIGSRRDGGYAEYVAVPIWNLIELPDTISFASAAMLEPLSVALHAIKVGQLQAGASVAIIGTGMIGISAGLWAHRFGAKTVTVIGRNEFKRKLVENCGLNYKLHHAQDVEEYDFVLEAVGSPESIELAIRRTAPAGTVVLMGNPSGNINLSQDLYWRILRKQLTLKGTWNSSYDGKDYSDWIDAVSALSDSSINVNGLMTHILMQEQLLDGLIMMRDQKEQYCKIMTLWNQN